ncbi:zf-HC2 domain-containing protein [bacterium]|nr:zf-HC2 domain-containing protein [bacterium]MBU1984760.1 zf-HC2 domain-containing protein [bacterium]
MFVDYVLDGLDERDSERFERHLFDCKRCFADLKEIAPTAAFLKAHRPEIIEELKARGIDLEELARTQHRHRGSWFAHCLDTCRRALRRLPRLQFALPAAAAAVVALLVVFSLRPDPDWEFPRLESRKVQLRAHGLSAARDEFERGRDEYDRNEYRSALPHFESATALAPEQGAYWLYLGTTYGHLKELKKCIAALSRADSLASESYREEVRYRLALAFVRNDQANRAKPLLDWVVLQGGPFAARADALLKKTDSRHRPR